MISRLLQLASVIAFVGLTAGVVAIKAQAGEEEGGKSTAEAKTPETKTAEKKESRPKAPPEASPIVTLPQARDVLEEPEGCLKMSTGPCGLEAGGGEKFSFPVGVKSRVILDERSGVLVNPSGDKTKLVYLVEGRIWVRASDKEPVTVKTEYGSATGSGDFWVERRADSVEFSAVFGDVVLTPKSPSGSPPSRIVVTEGLRNQLGRVDRDGVAFTGVPVPIEYQSHVRRWAALYESNSSTRTPLAKLFSADVERFRDVLTRATREVTEFHEELLTRKVASIEDEKAKREKAHEKIEARNRELREMFRRKALQEF